MVNILLEAVILFRYGRNIAADYKGYFSALETSKGVTSFDNVTKNLFAVKCHKSIVHLTP